MATPDHDPSARPRHGTPQVTKLQPHHWTSLVGTGLVIRWDGDQELAVFQQGGIWDLSPLTRRPGYVLGWIGLVDHPELGPWPLAPLTRRTTYVSRGGRTRE